MGIPNRFKSNFRPVRVTLVLGACAAITALSVGNGCSSSSGTPEAAPESDAAAAQQAAVSPVLEGSGETGSLTSAIDPSASGTDLVPKVDATPTPSVAAAPDSFVDVAHPRTDLSDVPPPEEIAGEKSAHRRWKDGHRRRRQISADTAGQTPPVRHAAPRATPVAPSSIDPFASTQPSAGGRPTPPPAPVQAVQVTAPTPTPTPVTRAPANPKVPEPEPSEKPSLLAGLSKNLMMTGGAVALLGLLGLVLLVRRAKRKF